MRLSLTVLVVWTISTLYFLGKNTIDDRKRKFIAYIHPEKTLLRTLSSVPPQHKTEKQVPQSLYARSEQNTEIHVPQSLYVKIENQDIFGRCDLRDNPVDFS